jgi:hypothetical protein
MIQLRSDCLVFRLASGDAIPCSAEMVTVELIGPASDLLDPEVVREAAASVLHYFRHELGRSEVTVHEFAAALERVLRSLGLNVVTDSQKPPPRVTESDLRHLAASTEKGFELAFFNQLRAEIHQRLAEAPQVLHFTHLRGCVKQLAGAQRWSPRCQRLQDQIVEFARGCWSAEDRPDRALLLVD